MINLKEKLTAIADKFRSVLGTTDLINPEDFTSKIDEVYESGKNSFWNDFTDNGARKNYNYGFFNSGFEYIRPPFKIIPSYNYIYRMFGNAKNLTIVEKDYFDFSSLTLSDTVANGGCGQVFNNCSSLVTIEDIGMPAGCYNYTFAACYNLQTIETLRFKETTLISNAFSECTALENIKNIEGVIGQDGLDLSASPCLSRGTLKTIIEHLSDNAVGKTVTFSLTAVNNAFKTSEGLGDGSESEEWTTLVATKSNWTISLL